MVRYPSSWKPSFYHLIRQNRTQTVCSISIPPGSAPQGPGNGPCHNQGRIPGVKFYQAKIRSEILLPGDRMTNIIELWSSWQASHRALSTTTLLNVVVLKPDVEWLGSEGWTIPLRKPPSMVSQLRKTPGNLDSAFVSHYTSHKSANMQRLWQDLQTSPGLRPWRGLLKEAISIIKTGDMPLSCPAFC